MAMRKVIRFGWALGLVALAAGTLHGMQSEPQKPAAAAFERLKALAGDWTVHDPSASTDPADQPSVAVQYRVTSGGSAVIETLFPGDAHEMITMYHLDGEDLVLTHYCAMANQPRMVLKSFTKDTLVFDFAGGTNVDPKKGTHMHDATIVLKGPDALHSDWSVFTDGRKVDTKSFELARIKK